MRVSLFSLSILAAALAVASVAIVIGLWIGRRRRDLALRMHARPVLVMPALAGLEPPRAPLSVTRDIVPVRRSPLTALAVAERLAPGDYSVTTGSPDRARAESSTGETRLPVAPVADAIVGHTVRFHVPAGVTGGLLRGALEVAEGPDAGLTVPFIHVAGDAAPVITFGRSEGPPFRHVQVLEPTVSRAHARMAYADDGWTLVNLSRTNPVLLNGEALEDEQPRRLAHGDRLEIGTVAFRYVTT